MNASSILPNLKKDFPASVVVVLVAVPLCLGIALGSGVPLFSGIIAGIVGGIVVGFFSGSQLSVSGPAAGLTVIVATAVSKLPGYEAFFLAVALSGMFQIIFGFINAGVIGDFIPNSVIKGMLASIGIILILKQMPFLVGYEPDFEGDENFQQLDNENTFSELLRLLDHITPGAILIGAISICVLIFWEMKSIKKSKILSSIPAPLLVVILSVLLNYYFKNGIPNLSIQQKHLVSLPVATDVKSFMSFLTFPEFKFVTNAQVWIAAFTIAVVGSLETLLGIEAVDKLDPLKRISPTNRELKAQGIGNLISGFLGGLPLTSVVVRSSANVNSGAQTKASTIMHGLLMLICVAFIPSILNLIPLSALAAILIFTGYKLSKVSLFKSFYKNGWDQFVPFVVTIIAILLTDLLKGICVGWAVGLFYMIRSNFRSAVFAVHDKNHFLIRFRKDVSFLNKPIVKRKLNEIPSDAFLIIDVSKANFIDKDIVEEINNFILNAASRNIKVEIKESHLKSGDKLFTQS